MKKTNDELRKSICAGLRMADRRTLKMIDALLTEYYSADDGEDDEELLKELNRVSDAVATGEMKTYAAEDAVEYVRKNRRKNKR